VIEKRLDNEGCILTIHSAVRNDTMKVYWNADTPERSKEISNGEEIFIFVQSFHSKRMESNSISLSMDEAECLRDVLDHMISELKKMQN
jgi:hypothetical protein